MDLLKAENDRLKVAPGPSAVPGSVPGHITSTSASSSPRRSLGLSLGHAFSPSLGDAGEAAAAAGDGEGAVATCCCSPEGSCARGPVVPPVPQSATAGFGSGWAGSGLVPLLSLQHSLTGSLPALSLDVSPMDAVSAGAQKEELTLRIVVRMPPQHIIKGVSVGCMGTLTCPSATALHKAQCLSRAGCSAPALHTSALAPRTSSNRSSSWAGPR